MPEENNFDVIIIGSGISGLTCASLLTQLRHKRVLVLERHFKPGGFTHVFRRNAGNTYEWDVGIHYVGDMAEGTGPRAIFDYITRKGVTWHKMSDPYDVFIYPDLTVELGSGREAFRSDLLQYFPGEAAAIDRYLIDIKKAASWLGRVLIAKNLPAWLKPLSRLLIYGGSRFDMTTSAYLEKNFKNEKLRSVLASQWGDYGLPPARSAFAVHAQIVLHYLKGAYYPVGGGKTIADSIIPVIERAGGKVLVNHNVEKINIENGYAVGVDAVRSQKDAPGERVRFTADMIISAAGARTTYGKLTAGDMAPELGELARSFEPGTATVVLYVGLKADPKTIGYNGANLWIYDGYDHDRTYAARNNIIKGEIHACYVSSPSSKNPKAGSHTMELICFADYEPFKAWAGKPWKKRGPEYEKLKEKISRAMIDFVEDTLPGFRALIDYHELSTPLSTEYFTGHRDGEIYGLPLTSQKIRQDWLRARTPVRNLFLTGSDTGTHGIVGAMMSGVITAGIIMGMPRAFMRIFSEAMKYHRSSPIKGSRESN
jgi:phytoene dehydrogenase-like protein